MIKWQNGFFGVSKAATLGWVEVLSSVANAAYAPKPSVPKDALLPK